jgi:hypothetical protein
MTFIARQRSIEWIVRALVPVLLGGVTYGTFWVASLFDEPPGLTLAGFAAFAVFVFLIAEGVRAISRALDHRAAWRDGVARRALSQLAATIAFSTAFALLIYVPLKLWQIQQGSRDTIAWPHLALTAALALCLALAINALQIVFDFYKSWQTARIEADRLREVALKAELEALKAQVNPHFLFNSLNALYGLIEEDPQRARALVLELSDVFRYVLTHAHGDLVSLAQELQFLDAYAALLGARHGSGFVIERDTGGEESRVSLPPMTLQLLVENAVKHNRVDAGDGLVVRIVREGDTLIVSNPLKPKRGATSGAGVGLDNIDQRYRLLNLRGVDVRREDERFIVRVPLLPCSP